MGPELSFSVTRTKISDKAGYNSLSVTFSSDIAYSEFECRATKIGADYGVEKGSPRRLLFPTRRRRRTARLKSMTHNCKR